MPSKPKTKFKRFGVSVDFKNGKKLEAQDFRTISVYANGKERVAR